MQCKLLGNLRAIAFLGVLGVLGGEIQFDHLIVANVNFEAIVLQAGAGQSLYFSLTTESTEDTEFMFV